MRIRNVLEEYECNLAPDPAGPSSAARGKAEWKRYEDGSRRFKVSISGLALSDGAGLDLLVDGERIGRTEILRGTARFRCESERGESVAPVRTGQVLQAVREGIVVLEGRFYAE